MARKLSDLSNYNKIVIKAAVSLDTDNNKKILGEWGVRGAGLFWKKKNFSLIYLY